MSYLDGMDSGRWRAALMDWAWITENEERKQENEQGYEPKRFAIFLVKESSFCYKLVAADQQDHSMSEAKQLSMDTCIEKIENVYKYYAHHQDVVAFHDFCIKMRQHFTSEQILRCEQLLKKMTRLASNQECLNVIYRAAEKANEIDRIVSSVTDAFNAVMEQMANLQNRPRVNQPVFSCVILPGTGVCIMQ